MSPSLQELAEKLGIRLPGAHKTKVVPKPGKNKAAPPDQERRRYGGEFCAKGHPYGDHWKKTVTKGKEYRVRYCRVCATETERRRRERQRQG